MNIKYGNMLDVIYESNAEVLVVTTNGFVKKNGRNVMGMGIAWQVLNELPDIDLMYGSLIKEEGHKVHIINHPDSDVPVVMFPVKPVTKVITDMNQVVGHMYGNCTVGQEAPGWATTADLAIIEQSAKQLKELADTHGWKRVIAPRFGCGAGELSWEDVEPVVAPYLDDRFDIYTFKKNP